MADVLFEDTLAEFEDASCDPPAQFGVSERQMRGRSIAGDSTVNNWLSSRPSIGGRGRPAMMWTRSCLKEGLCGGIFRAIRDILPQAGVRVKTSLRTLIISPDESLRRSPEVRSNLDADGGSHRHTPGARKIVGGINAGSSSLRLLLSNTSYYWLFGSHLDSVASDACRFCDCREIGI
jgi:hypothetical protein